MRSLGSRNGILWQEYENCLGNGLARGRKLPLYFDDLAPLEHDAYASSGSLFKLMNESEKLNGFRISKASSFETDDIQRGS